MIVFHDNNGHLGVEKTRDLTQRQYWCPSMRKDIREYVDYCHTCQTINARTTRNEGCLIPRDIPTEPNAVMSLDHMGPLNEKGDHILVCIDHATRYMDAVTVPSTSSTHYLDFMTNRWIPRFGVLSVIITDQAKGFVNKKTNQFHHRLGIAHQNSTPCWPQSNGLIERMVGTLKQVLRKMLNNKDKWQKELPRAMLAINATKHRHSGHSPFRLMHGYDPKLPGELNLTSVERDIDESHRLHDLARKQRTPRFITGDLVLLELSARGTLDPRYDGPFEITALVGGNRAEIQRVPHTPGMINQKIINVEHLRRYKEPLLEVTEPSPSNDTHA
ncbi:hypothetical protein MRX96_021347 [Rhipicephalus microplus]